MLLYEQADVLDARHNLTLAYPELKVIRDVYQALGNYYQIPVGMGKDDHYDFDLAAFSDQYGFQNVITYNSLKFLEREGYLILNDGFHHPSRVFIKASKEELYRFQVEHARFDPLVKTLLRSYGGILNDFTTVNEAEVGRRCHIQTNEVIEGIRYLEKLQLLDYLPQTDKPQVIFATERVDIRHISISVENYRDRLQQAEKRMETMISYAESTNKCRSQQLLAYFGETNTKRCGRCDVCIERNKVDLNEIEFNNIVGIIKPLLHIKPCTLAEIVAAADNIHEDKVLRVIQWLTDNEKILVNPNREYFWNK